MNLQDISTEALQAELAARQKSAEIVPEQEPSMNVSMFYRGRDKTLHRIDVACDSVKEAAQAVMEQLNKDKEVFYKPLLGLITCGKAVAIFPKETA